VSLLRGETKTRPAGAPDRKWIEESIEFWWGSTQLVVHDSVFRLEDLSAMLALNDGRRVGLATYRFEGHSCEIITLNSVMPGHGIGRALIDAMKTEAMRAGCERLWLITTNDNLRAQKFYRDRGFVHVRTDVGAVTRARRLKPEIALTGEDGTPIEDELEFEMKLEPRRPWGAVEDPD
jgi:N-acetylglutamate synthase-like GNAT family acetyltransferase